jgi:hypothetical protein
MAEKSNQQNAQQTGKQGSAQSGIGAAQGGFC